MDTQILRSVAIFSRVTDIDPFSSDFAKGNCSYKGRDIERIYGRRLIHRESPYNTTHRIPTYRRFCLTLHQKPRIINNRQPARKSAESLPEEPRSTYKEVVMGSMNTMSLIAETFAPRKDSRIGYRCRFGEEPQNLLLSFRRQESSHRLDIPLRFRNVAP